MRSTVSVLKTTPSTVLDDIARAMELAQFRACLPSGTETILKINISWQHYYPACSTTPWQFDGVTRTLTAAGYHGLVPAQNRTVVVDPEVGAVNNHLVSVLEKYGLRFHYLYKPGVKWIVYRPQGKLLVLDKIFPDGIQIPDLMMGRNAVHLPTMKTHVFTTTTGAMKNAFGGLLNDNRHWTHRVIHETLVDLLMIQKEIHPGIFAVMDGTIAGDGAGPRAMVPHVKNYVLASGDMVAIDAVAAKMMGFDPMALRYIRIAHEKGLGKGDPRDIKVVGADTSRVNFGFKVKETLASRGQKAIYYGFLRPFEHLLLRTWLVPWSYFASRLYHDVFWYNLIGKRRVKKILKTEWGVLFQSYARRPS